MILPEHLEKQVKKSMKTRKIILFIVEGVTDKISLGEVIDSFIDDYEVRFHVVNGDLTTNWGNSPKNIINKVNNHINKFLSLHGFKKTDLYQVVQIADTDACFVAEKYLQQAHVEKIYYEEDKVLVVNKDRIVQRNKTKSGNLMKLSSIKTINEIPYSIYYNSCNLEHVLHNERDLSDGKKRAYAEKFIDKYYGKESDLLNFLSNSGFSVKGDYKQTWKFIEQGGNSLKRNTNFHLFFQKNASTS